MKAAERSAARLAVVQALYEMDVAGKGVVDALAEFEAFWIGREVEGVQHAPAETGFFRELLRGVVEEQRAVDPRLDAALSVGWPLTRVEAVLRAILRAGAYELLFRPDVPPRVAISEYVDVAHSFYHGDEPGLVNAVLDRIAREDRPDALGPGKANGGKPGTRPGARPGGGKKRPPRGSDGGAPD